MPIGWQPLLLLMPHDAMPPLDGDQPVRAAVVRVLACAVAAESAMDGPSPTARSTQEARTNQEVLPLRPHGPRPALFDPATLASLGGLQLRATPLTLALANCQTKP